MTYEQLIRHINIMGNGEIDFFLGAGASVGSGIPSGGDLIWYFKRKIYCDANHITHDEYKDLYLPSTRKTFQQYFDAKGNYPELNSAFEYSYYFQECFPLAIARQRFIDSQVSNKNPSLGYLCLADLIVKDRIKNIWTTNFDCLTETAVSIVDPQNNILVCSSSNSSSVGNFNSQYPCVCKLHGDFRYDMLKNTTDELKSLEDSLYEYWYQRSINHGIIFVGYSGYDDSIMNFLEKHIEDESFLNKGFFWTTIKNGRVSPRVSALIDKAKKNGKNAEIVEIDSFDNFMYYLYKQNSGNNSLIETQWKTRRDAKTPIDFDIAKSFEFTKLNAYIVEKLPKCNVFKTDITTWKQLRECIGNKIAIAGLYNGNVYSFESREELTEIFSEHIKSEIIEDEVECRVLNRNDSVYIGLIYGIIEQYVKQKKLLRYARNKYYIPESYEDEEGIRIFDAVEIVVEYIEPNMFLFLLPTVYITKANGQAFSKKDNQYYMNCIVSKIYNKEYNERLKKYELLFRKEGRLYFEYKNVKITCILPAVSSGGENRKANWFELPSYLFEEPKMCFSNKSDDKISINQLKGLVNYGPIDHSYIPNDFVRPPIQLAVLFPVECKSDILRHLNSLNSRHSPKNDGFLQIYNGFSSVYRRQLIIPDTTNRDLCVSYVGKSFLSKGAEEFLKFLKRAIDYFSQHMFDFNILVIYIPKMFSKFREAKEISEDFNLHDAIKLYATEKGVPVQFIEERSLASSDHCKVVWGLSTSLYVKAQGVLWHPKSISEDTAYIGIGYAKSEKKGICIGCSQLFDSTGTGIRMILRKIKNPKYQGKKNPYMNKDEAREMMLELRKKYYDSCPTSKIKRVVIHKTTPFMTDEIIGITQAFEGVEIDLIQIQEYSPWRGIRFGYTAGKDAYGFAMKRGVAIKLNQESFLLWSHGCLMHEDLCGSNKNFYKNGKGIPTPLLVKKYYGTGRADIIANEILMLTKMNWNSGDTLYKILPVTLDFAKILSRMSKQDEAIYDKAYDFRFFM